MAPTESKPFPLGIRWDTGHLANLWVFAAGAPLDLVFYLPIPESELCLLAVILLDFSPGPRVLRIKHFTADTAGLA